MAITIVHAFQSAVADAQASGFVKPSNWNAGHVITLAASSLLGRYSNTPGAAQEISPNGDFALSTSTGVLALANSGVTAGTYYNSNLVVDAKGRITSISDGTSSGGASALSEYILGSAEATYPNSRVLTDTATIDVDLGTASQAKFNVITSGLNASELLTLLLTVDGAASGLDADLLDGQSSAYYATATSVSDHLADALAAHAATAISVAPAGTLAATEVQAALVEILGDVEAHVADAAGAHAATAISFTPDGTIAATTVQAAIVEVRDEAQPLDADLTSIAALTTTAYGRAFLELANEAAFKAAVNLEIGTDVQAYDADLTTWAGLTPSANAQSLVTAADYAAMKALLDLEIGTDVQAYDADLTTWAGLTPSANAQSLVTAANYAAMRALLDLEAGTDFLSPAAIAAAYQALDATLTAWAGITVTQGALFHGAGADSFTVLAKDTNATRYLSNTGTSNDPAWAQVNLTNGVTGDLPFSSLAQGDALSVLGVTGNATADNASIAAGTDHHVLRRSGTAVAFGQVNLASTNAVTGQLVSGSMPALTGAVVSAGGVLATTSTFNIVVSITDGTGAAIATGIKVENDLYTSFAFTITGWTLLADTSGAIVVDVWRDTYANYPPTDADSITNGSEPEIVASGDDAQDTNLGDWTDVTMDAGIVMRFNVDSCTSITKAVLILHCTKTS
jgi:hypothetical protein